MRVLTDQPTLVEQVFDEILSDIVEGRLAPGARVIQEDIAAALDVSRQPVQQALLLLRSEGFVRETSGRRLTVAPIDIAFVRDIYEVRAATEGLACRLAARRGRKRAEREARRHINLTAATYHTRLTLDQKTTQNAPVTQTSCTSQQRNP